MQALDWNDLRYLLALAQGGSLAAAARQLGVNATTVGRRLRAAEAALGARLFVRLPDGGLRPSDTGAVALAQAERVAVAMAGLLGAVAGADATPAGVVRITAVPLLVHHLLVPAAATLTGRHPGLRLELIAEPRNLSLGRHEADIALRLARPAPDAGKAVLARRIGTLAHAVYVPASCPPEAEAALPWLGYEAAMAGLPPARWLALAGRDHSTAPIACNDAEAILQAVGCGLGRSLLPCRVADRAPGLRRGAVPPGLPPLPAREVWLLVHPELRPLARIVAMLAWIEQLLAPPLPAADGESVLAPSEHARP